MLISVNNSGLAPNNDINIIDEHSPIMLDLNSRKFQNSDNYVVSVTQDNNSQVITFQLSGNVYDGVDLTGVNCYVDYYTEAYKIYTNPLTQEKIKVHSQGSIYLQEIVEGEGENAIIKYEWLLDNRQTFKDGRVKYGLTFQMEEDDASYVYTEYNDATEQDWTVNTWFLRLENKPYILLKNKTQFEYYVSNSPESVYRRDANSTGDEYIPYYILKTGVGSFDVIKGLDIDTTYIFEDVEEPPEMVVNISVDDELSSVSNNPVKNKVISDKIIEIESNIDFIYLGVQEAQGDIVDIQGDIVDVQGDVSGLQNNLADIIADALSDFTTSTAFINAVFLADHPVNSLYTTLDNTNPGGVYGGEWEQVAQGRAVVGVGTGTDENNVAKAFTVGENEGEYKHTLTVDEMPSHTHDSPTSGNSTSGSYEVGRPPGVSEYDYYPPAPTTSVGGDQAHNNIQPSYGVYIWKRIA